MITLVRQIVHALGGEGLPPQSRLAYAFATLCVGLAFLAHLGVLQVVQGVAPSILYNPALFVAALVGGTGPGCLAAALGGAFLWLTRSMGMTDDPMLGQATGWLLYVFAAALIVCIAQCYRSFHNIGRRAEQNGGSQNAPGTSSGLGRAGRYVTQRITGNPIAGYLFAFACIAIASCIRWSFAAIAGNALPLVSYYPAILVAALVGGTGPGLFAMLASLVVLEAEFPGPLLSFELPAREEGVSLALYVFACILSMWLAEKHRHRSLPHEREPIVLRFVTAILVAIAAILLTTLGLLAMDSYLDADHLVLGYLLPTVVIAMHYGSPLAVLTSFASSVAAAYFLFPPKFSFYVSAPEHVAELGLFLVLAVIASKAVAALADEAHERA
jgi:Domain of unknown function (DUF4118)